MLQFEVSIKQKEIMNKKIIYATTLLVAFNLSTYAQFGKLKGMMGKKDTTKTEEPKKDEPKKAGGLTSGGLMNKVMGKMAKVAGAVGGGMTGMITTISDFNGIALTAGYLTNLHPEEVGTIDQSFFEGYEPGGNVLFLMFSSKESLKFTKVGGTVTIDGKPANYVSMGIYSAYFKDNDKPKLVEAKTTSGQYTSFTINPPKQKVKVLAINNQKSDISVDLTQDMTIDLGELDKNDKSPILVQLSGSKIGIKTFYTVGYFQPSPKLIIPAAAFRNMDGAGSNFTDNTYIQLTRSTEEPVGNLKGDLPEIVYSSGTSDGKFIKVANKAIFNKEIEIKGNGKGTNELPFTINKPLALQSPNLSRLKKIAVTSFSAQGKTSYFKDETKYNLGGGTTRTIESVQFPVFPEQYWNSILEKMYKEMSDILVSELNVEMVPIEKVTSSEGYKIIAPFSKEDANTKKEFVQTYKNTKLLSGIRPLTLMIGKRSGEYKIMEATGANATMRFNIGLNLVHEGTRAVMQPTVNFEIAGELLGDMMNTTYLSGSIVGAGTGMKNKQNIDQKMLEDVYLRRGDLMNTFKIAIQQLKAKEKLNTDYEIEWNAMTK